MNENITPIRIPEDIQFSDLELTPETDGSVSFNLSVVQRICIASNIDPSIFFDGPEENITKLLVQWYLHHRSIGGELDPVAENLLSEAQFETAAGQATSHQPGHA